MINQQILLTSRPAGEATAANFMLVETPVPELKDGQVLVRHHFLSLDPYMRGRMNDARSYAAPQPLNEVMVGGTVGEVVASRHPSYAAGDRVVGMGGWQQYSIASGGAMLRKVDASRIPLSAYLGAVGSVVGQLAKARGCRAVGVAGGREKCDYVVRDLGFDACIDYKQHADAKSLYQALKAATPDGIHGHFENVGGAVLDAVLVRINDFGRIALCGMISGYDGKPIPLQQPQLILTSRLLIQGFIVSEHMDVWPDALAELGRLVAEGKLKYRETIAQGLESAPEAFLGLLKGRNFGKQLVKLI